MTPLDKRRGKGIPIRTEQITARLTIARLETLRRIAASEVPKVSLTGMIERAIAHYLASLPDDNSRAPDSPAEHPVSR